MVKRINKIIYQFFRKRGIQIIRIPKYAICYTDQKRLIGKINPVILDIGAHQGESIALYKNQFPEASFIAFEPFPASFEKLRQNTAQFANVKTINAAVGNQTGQVTFYSNHYSQTNSILPVESDASKYFGANLLETKASTMVECIRLDDFIDQHPLTSIDILKIDTQGFEYEVLEGAIQTLSSGKVKLVYCEVILTNTYKGQHRIDEVIARMHDYGFFIFNIYNLSYTGIGRLRQVDILFIHQSFLKHLEA